MAASVRLGPKLKELRIHLCQKTAASEGARQFMTKHYVPLKTNNPTFPILVREASGITPVLWARYEYGQEQKIPLDNHSADGVLSIIERVSQQT